MIKKWLAVLVKFIISVALIMWLMDGIDLTQAWDRARDADRGLLAFSLLIVVFQIFMGGVRWRAVMLALNVPFKLSAAVRIFYIGAFFNQTLPSSVGGDAVRMYMAFKSGMNLPKAINGVMLERVSMIAALVIILAVIGPLFVLQLEPSLQIWMWLVLAAMVVGLLSGLAFIMILDRLPEKFKHWRLVRGLGHLAGDTRMLFLNVKQLLPVLLWCVIATISISFFVYVLGLSLGLEFKFTDALVLVPGVLLVATVPISIGGWGVREGAMVSAFSLVGVPASGALVLSLLMGLVAMIVALPGGLVWLFSRDKNSTSLKEMEQKIENEMDHVQDLK